MKTLSALATVILAYASLAFPQGRPVDWPSYGGDARRSHWQKSDLRITKDNAKDLQLVLKRKLENGAGGPHALTPPVIIGLLISYRGFKELGFVAGSSGRLWSLDVDLNRVFWDKQFPSQRNTGACAGSVPAIPTLTPPAAFGARRPSTTKPPVGSASPGLPPTPAGRSTELPARVPARVGGTGFGAPRPLYVLAADGSLRQVNTSNGGDQFPPLKFLPGSARASSLTMNDYVVYTTTSGNCGGVPNAVWAINLALEEPEVVSFPLTGGEAQGASGFAIGNDGTVYVQTGPGQSDPGSGKWANTLLALAPKTLKLQSHFSVSDNNKNRNTTTPVVFEYKDRDLVATAGADGRLYLLDSRSVGGQDGKTPLSQTVPIASGNGGISGGLSTWEDADGARWVAAPVWGALNSELKVPVTNGPTPNGSVVAFKVEEQNGSPVLVPAWVSRDLQSPVPPVITSGVLFALSTAGRATLYALDGSTGKAMYSTGTQVAAPGSLTGLTVANGRVYFTTTDNTLYAFGIHMEI